MFADAHVDIETANLGLKKETKKKEREKSEHCSRTSARPFTFFVYLEG